MMVKRPLFFLLMLLPGFISASSCKNDSAENERPSSDSSYFSIRDFAKDQIQTYYGQPFALYRIVHLNGGLDSSLVNFMNMDWPSILGIFYATDISARKFLGKYSFSVFDEATTGSRGYTYTATDPKAFTRLLIINTDPDNNRITSIYIETAKHDFFSNKTQKLLYVPLHIIQIQETEGGFFGKTRNLRVDYKFMQDDAV